jgi:hypothetical protein
MGESSLEDGRRAKDMRQIGRKHSPSYEWKLSGSLDLRLNPVRPVDQTG